MNNLITALKENQIILLFNLDRSLNIYILINPLTYLDYRL